MRGKNGMKKWLGAVLGMGILTLGAAWFGGCTLLSDERCACDAMYVWKEVVVVDGNGVPVDSAVITVVRASDGNPYKVPDNGFIDKKPGHAMAFDDGILNEIPSGKLEVAIRVTASKGGKSGEQIFVVASQKCRCHFEVKSGRDTVVIQ